ncbi:VOC family protein [Nonomuraea dietziae]|uniref:VOC family protein n=1 Tax=Nonomuraea dietziae TaxID=65515 RepID=UPI0031CDD2D5
MSLDHLVYAVPDLEEGVAAFAERTGVRPVKGGSHPGGTANYLVGLGPTAYLEIIGPDPEVEGARPRAFGLETLTEARLAAWAIRPEDLDATVERARRRGYDPGEVHPLSRRTPDGTLLEWRLTRRDDPAAIRPVPFLIDWGATAHTRRLGAAAAHPGRLRRRHARRRGTARRPRRGRRRPRRRGGARGRAEGRPRHPERKGGAGMSSLREYLSQKAGGAAGQA